MTDSHSPTAASEYDCASIRTRSTSAILRGSPSEAVTPPTETSSLGGVPRLFDSEVRIRVLIQTPRCFDQREILTPLPMRLDCRNDAERFVGTVTELLLQVLAAGPGAEVHDLTRCRNRKTRSRGAFPPN